MNKRKTEIVGQGLEIDDGKKKWQGKEIGVNSDIPLKDDGTGRPYIIRQFEFRFDPTKIKDIQNKKIPAPTQQELFNSVWGQIRRTLWGDGIVAIEDPKTPPRILIFKKHFKVIILCEPKFGVLVADKIQTLQEITKPQSLTNLKDIKHN